MKWGGLLILVFSQILLQIYSHLWGYKDWKPDFLALFVLAIVLTLPFYRAMFISSLIGWLREGLAALPFGSYSIPYLLLGSFFCSCEKKLHWKGRRVLYLFLLVFFSNGTAFFASKGMPTSIKEIYFLFQTSSYTLLFLPLLFLHQKVLSLFKWEEMDGEKASVESLLLFHVTIKEDEEGAIL